MEDAFSPYSDNPLPWFQESEENVEMCIEIYQAMIYKAFTLRAERDFLRSLGLLRTHEQVVRLSELNVKVKNFATLISNAEMRLYSALNNS